jgi:hypothetical protein
MCRPVDVGLHPAAAAWRALGGSVAPTFTVEQLRRKRRRSWVVRIRGVDAPSGSLVAKCIPAGIAQRELAVYRKVLPICSVTAPALLGSAPAEPTEEFTGWLWLFLEDVGDEKCDPLKFQDRHLAGDWLLHFSRATSSLSPDDVPDLVHRGAAHYRRFLDQALTARRRPDVATALENAGMGTLAEDLDYLADRWSRMEELLTQLPPAIIHGDFLAKNLGVRMTASGKRVLYPFDWDNAAWGFPAFDLAHLGLPSPGLSGHLRDLAPRYAELLKLWSGLPAAASLAGAARTIWSLCVTAPTLASLETPGSRPNALDDLALFAGVLHEAVGELGLD